MMDLASSIIAQNLSLTVQNKVADLLKSPIFYSHINQVLNEFKDNGLEILTNNTKGKTGKVILVLATGNALVGTYITLTYLHLRDPLMTLFSILYAELLLLIENAIPMLATTHLLDMFHRKLALLHARFNTNGINVETPVWLNQENTPITLDFVFSTTEDVLTCQFLCWLLLVYNTIDGSLFQALQLYDASETVLSSLIVRWSAVLLATNIASGIFFIKFPNELERAKFLQGLSPTDGTDVSTIMKTINLTFPNFVGWV